LEFHWSFIGNTVSTRYRQRIHQQRHQNRARRRASPSPAQETTRKTTTVSDFIEQKNGAVAREYSRLYRLEGLEEQTLLATVYKPLVPLLNFFTPSQKLSRKTRAGFKEIAETLFPKVYDNPQSPFQRLIKCAKLPEVYKDTLKAQCSLCNPVEFQRNVNKAVPCLRHWLAQSNRSKTREQESLSVPFSKSQGAALGRHP
jgi:hypothetical protein